MWFFNKKEIRNNEAPHKEVQQSVCDEVNQGIGLVQKLLNLKGYDALSQSSFFGAVNLISNSVAVRISAQLLRQHRRFYFSSIVPLAISFWLISFINRHLYI